MMGTCVLRIVHLSLTEYVILPTYSVPTYYQIMTCMSTPRKSFDGTRYIEKNDL